jgi:hypothetical protein
MFFSSEDYKKINNHVIIKKQTKNKLRDLSPRVNYTDRATAAC